MSENTKSILGILAFVAVVGVIVIAFIQLRPISASERRVYGDACTEWIAKDFNGGRSARISDVWRKRGSIVFEVLASNADSSRTSVYLCVVDPKKGTLFKPSVFENSSWRRSFW